MYLEGSVCAMVPVKFLYQGCWRGEGKKVDNIGPGGDVQYTKVRDIGTCASAVADDHYQLRHSAGIYIIVESVSTGDSCTSTCSCVDHYHNCRFKSSHHSLEIGHNLPGVVAWDGGGVSRPDTITAIDEDHGENGAVPLWLDLHVVLEQVVKLRVVRRMEDTSREWAQHREDVSGERSERYTSLSAEYTTYMYVQK